MKNCASDFAPPISLLLNRSLSTCVFPEIWKLSYVKPIFKKGRRNNVEDYRGVAILSAIPNCFQLLVYGTMYEGLKNLISVNQHGFIKNRSTVTNLLEYSSLILNSIEEGWQVDSVYTDFSNAFDPKSTVSVGDFCGYSKDKNRRRCFQAYQGDIGCPTG
jgi:hypothetical protein